MHRAKMIGGSNRLGMSRTRAKSLAEVSPTMTVMTEAIKKPAKRV